MRKIFLALLAICFATSAQAAVVHLKNGASVTGDIMERTAESVRVNVDGIKVTYYNDEIESVDDGVASVVPAPVAVVPPILTSQELVYQPTVVLPVSSASLTGMSKKDLILKFIIVFGTRDTMKANFDQMALALPPEKGVAFRKAFNVDTVINLLVPVYDKYFSEADLKAYIEFYSSEAGAKLNKSLGSVMNESVDATMKYFELNMPPELKEQKQVSTDEAGVPLQLPVPNK